MLTHVGRVTVKERERNAREPKKMMKLISCGLVGLAAFRVMAFCFAYRDELPPAREKSVLDLVNDADLNDSPMIETGVGVPWFRGTAAKQRQTAPGSLLRTTPRTETGSGAIWSDGRQCDRGQVEGLHG